MHACVQLEVPDQESLPDDAPGWADERPYRPLALQLAAEREQPPQLLFRRFGIRDMGRPTSVEECAPIFNTSLHVVCAVHAAICMHALLSAQVLDTGSRLRAQS